MGFDETLQNFFKSFKEKDFGDHWKRLLKVSLELVKQLRKYKRIHMKWINDKI